MKRFALLITAFAGFVFIPWTGHGIASASERETELFNRGYGYLFSCNPDKAAESFRIFLKEFPESSARDAAMFWLGKTLISMKLYREAEVSFQTIQIEDPDSPYIAFINIEMDEIAKSRSTGSANKAKEPSEPQKNVVPKEANDEATSQGTDRKLTQVLEDKGTAESNAVVRIRNRDYPLTQVIDHQISASLVFKLIGIKDIVWRTGNPLDDFLAEELLLMEAKKANITIDTKKQKEMVKSYKLNAAEADYLEKFMTIAGYIDTQYTNSTSEKPIKPASGRVPFNPFIEMKADRKEKIRSFVKSYLDELKKRN